MMIRSDSNGLCHSAERHVDQNIIFPATQDDSDCGAIDGVIPQLPVDRFDVQRHLPGICRRELSHLDFDDDVAM